MTFRQAAALLNVSPATVHRWWHRYIATLLRTSYIEPGSPWENPFVESFSGRLRNELLNIEEFGSITEARVVIEDWRHEYNTYRPHTALGGPLSKRVRHNHKNKHLRTRIAPGLVTGTPSPPHQPHPQPPWAGQLVRPEQVVHAGDGCLSPDGLVWSSMVVGR